MSQVAIEEADGKAPSSAGAAVRAHLEESIGVKQALLAHVEVIARVSDLLVARLRSGNKLVVFGNGGSAADAQHIAAELVGRLECGEGGLPALALTTDSSILTAISNDFGLEQVFVRQVRAHVRPGDVALGISTSGRSPNVLAGLREARERGAWTVGLAGMSPAEMATLCDHVICVPSARTMRIQECHITIGHILCHAVERAFYPQREA